MIRLTFSYHQLCTFIDILLKTNQCEFESITIKSLSIAVLKPFALRLYQRQFPVKDKIGVQVSIAECICIDQLFQKVICNDEQLHFIAEFHPKIQHLCMQNSSFNS